MQDLAQSTAHLGRPGQDPNLHFQKVCRVPCGGGHLPSCSRDCVGTPPILPRVPLVSPPAGSTFLFHWPVHLRAGVPGNLHPPGAPAGLPVQGSKRPSSLPVGTVWVSPTLSLRFLVDWSQGGAKEDSASYPPLHGLPTSWSHLALQAFP